MKIRAIALVGLIFCLALPPVLSAQEYVATPVKVSTERVRLNGKVYLAHPVEERQTLFSIAKAYGVTVDDLYAANEGLEQNGLKAGSILLVPIVEGAQKAAAEPARQAASQEKAQAAPQGQSFVEHTVMWYEDLDDIAAQYGVTPEEIMQANGMRGKKVTKRQVLKIPVKAGYRPATPVPDQPKEEVTPKKETEPKKEAASKKEAEPKKEAAPKQEEKTVAPPELPTLEDPVIKDLELVSAGKYKPLKVDKVKVKKADILPPDIPTIEDPEITDPEIATGTYNPLTVDPLTVDLAKARETEAADEDEDDNIFDWLTGKGSVELGLLLPFNAAGRASETNMDFYSGVLMALHDLESSGIKATLNVYDLQDGVPSALELEKNDFILGPITSTDLASVLERTEGRIPVISPLDQKAGDLADTRPGFIQAPSTATSQYTELAAWAADDRQRDDQIILVTEKVAGGTAAATGVQEALLAAGTPFESVSWTVAEGRSLPASLTSRLTKTGVNRIIVASEKESFVGDMVRNLVILLGRGYRIAMYAPSKVRTFETIDGSTYHQNDLHICSQYFADYDTPEVKSFVRTYRALYRTEPSQFAFQGYDLTHYFAGLVSKYGNRWTRALTRVPDSGLHTDFRFEKTPSGSFRNTGIRRIVYNTDYSTSLVR